MNFEGWTSIKAPNITRGTANIRVFMYRTYKHKGQQMIEFLGYYTNTYYKHLRGGVLIVVKLKNEIPATLENILHIWQALDNTHHGSKNIESVRFITSQ